MTDHQGQNLEVIVNRAGSAAAETVSIKPRLGKNQNILSTQDYIGELPGLTNLSKMSLLGVAANSQAYAAGLRTGDLITSINGAKIKFFRELENIFVAQQGQEMLIEAERYDVNDPSKSTKENISFKSNSVPSLQSIGIEKSELFLAKIVKDSPAEAAGMKSGDKVISINGKAPHKWEDILDNVKAYNEKDPLVFEVLQGTELKKLEIVPKMTTQMNAHGGEDKRFTVGIIPWSMPSPPEISIVKADGILQGLARGLDKSIEVTQMTIVSFLRLIQAKISPKNIGGVISIGQAANETFKLGWSHFIQMMGVISINLFILNLLPVQALNLFASRIH
jgi:regulator of sigma E protease